MPKKEGRKWEPIPRPFGSRSRHLGVVVAIRESESPFGSVCPAGVDSELTSQEKKKFNFAIRHFQKKKLI